MFAIIKTSQAAYPHAQISTTVIASEQKEMKKKKDNLKSPLQGVAGTTSPHNPIRTINHENPRLGPRVKFLNSQPKPHGSYYAPETTLDRRYHNPSHGPTKRATLWITISVLDFL